jgi:DNA-binding GntR family transcriptional regulator
VRDTSVAPSVADLASELGADQEQVHQALFALADEHLLALLPGGHDIVCDRLRDI